MLPAQAFRSGVSCRNPETPRFPIPRLGILELIVQQELPLLDRILEAPIGNISLKTLCLSVMSPPGGIGKLRHDFL